MDKDPLSHIHHTEGGNAIYPVTIPAPTDDDGMNILCRLAGKWKEESCENLDEFMKALDVNIIKRFVGDHTVFKEEWELHGNEVVMTVHNKFKTTTCRFRLNEYFEDDTMDGKRAKVVYSARDGTLICRQQRWPNDVIHCREIQLDDKMKLTLYVDTTEPVVATIIYKKNDEHLKE